MELTVNVFDKDNNEWVDLLGKASVKAMKEDFLKDKNEISLMKVTPFGTSEEQPNELFVPYDAEVLKNSGFSENSMKSQLSMYINDDTESLAEVLDINTGEGNFLLTRLGIFDCIVETIDSVGNKSQLRGKNYEIQQFDLQNAKEFTISYVFNDHAIPEKSYKYVKE